MAFQSSTTMHLFAEKKASVMSESAKCTGAHYAKWEQKRNLKLAQKRLLKVGPIVNSQPSRKRKKRRRPGRGRSGRHLVGGGASSEEPNQFKRRELKHRAKRILHLTSDEVSMGGDVLTARILSAHPDLPLLRFRAIAVSGESISSRSKSKSATGSI